MNNTTREPDQIGSERAEAVVSPKPIFLDTDIRHLTSKFTEEIDSLADTRPLAMRSIADALKRAIRRIDRMVEDNHFERDEAQRTITIPVEHLLRSQRLLRSLSRVRTASVLVPRSFFVNLVSQYDAFIGRLIRALLLTKPDVLNASEKTLSFAELLAFGSMDAARDHIVEKEVESVLRKSHTEHFDWLENKFSIKLRDNLKVWPRFIELTERRNLCVHTGGHVSSQYLQICQAHKVDCGTVKVGDALEIPPAYFRQAHEAVFEIGVKLAQVLWRKVRPTELPEADSHLIQVTYHLLVERKFDLAKALLDFATDVLKRYSSTECRLHFVVNRAQAYKWSGDEAGMRAILDKEDFSALSDTFKLANAVLRDDFATAYTLITRMGRTGPISIGDYREWPLFQGLRKEAKFNPVILSVFGESKEVTLRTPGAGSSLLEGDRIPEAQEPCRSEPKATPDTLATDIQAEHEVALTQMD